MFELTPRFNSITRKLEPAGENEMAAMYDGLPGPRGAAPASASPGAFRPETDGVASTPGRRVPRRAVLKALASAAAVTLASAALAGVDESRGLARAQELRTGSHASSQPRS